MDQALSVVVPAPPKVACDTSLLIGAASYVEPLPSGRDPYSRTCFEAVVTVFCSGCPLVMPLPQFSSPETIPIFTSAFSVAGYETVKGLEPSSQGVSATAATLAPLFARSVEGDPTNTAAWLKFQMASDVFHAHLERSDLEGVLACTEVAAALIDSGGLPHLQHELAVLQRAGPILLPREMEGLLPRAGGRDCLLTAYALGSFLRGFWYGPGIAMHANTAIYRPHWIRNFALERSDILEENHTERLVMSCFPWGSILASMLDGPQPAVEKDKHRVLDIILALREASPAVQSLLRSADWETRPIAPNRLSDAEIVVLDALRSTRVQLDWKKTKRLGRLHFALLALGDAAGTLSKVVGKVVTASLHAEWLRELDEPLQATFNRDEFWSLYADPGIRASVKKFRRGLLTQGSRGGHLRSSSQKSTPQIE